MKIDIHTHTKKTKQGDSKKRNIDAERFADMVKSTDVKILAITNHNHFDLKQFNEFQSVVPKIILLPGVELDIRTENGNRAHLLVIANPKYASIFDKKINYLITGNTIDSFTITLSDIVPLFKECDPIYVAHYIAKKPDLSDEDIARLVDIVGDENRVLKEASNSISAGIYISHGHKSIYGSDVSDWDKYPQLAERLPDLRLPVESYEQLCLLLEKDTQTIDTILNKKTKENIALNPWDEAYDRIEIDIYNDINVLFGSKGTGKTDILKSLSKYFNKKGYKTVVYESNARHLKDEFDIKATLINSIDLNSYEIDDCTNEFVFLKEVADKEVTRITKYKEHFASQELNRIARQIQVKGINIEDESATERSLNDAFDALKIFEDFEGKVFSKGFLDNLIDSTLASEFQKVFVKVLSSIKETAGDSVLRANEIKMLNSLVNKFNEEISKKTGRPEKPTETGFSSYAKNRIEIERTVSKILSNIKSEIKPSKDYVGFLGEKGELYCQTNFLIQNGTISVSDYKPIKNVNKTPQKNISKTIESIYKHIYREELFDKFTTLSNIEGADTINSIEDLVLCYKHFLLNGKEYSPSNGESSMVLLHNELKKYKDIYLIDEPEKSLGNDYINNVIVPLLKEHAKMGRRVIVATHDANIAVRTLPYQSIYREHDVNGYNTYSGNPFSNNLIAIKETETCKTLDWKLTSMKTLEGGKEAFGERGKIYGNN